MANSMETIESCYSTIKKIEIPRAARAVGAKT